MVDIFADTSGATTALKNRAAAVASALSGDKVPGTFDIGSMRKDMRTMLEEAESLGLDLPLTRNALQCFDQGPTPVWAVTMTPISPPTGHGAPRSRSNAQLDKAPLAFRWRGGRKLVVMPTGE